MMLNCETKKNKFEPQRADSMASASSVYTGKSDRGERWEAIKVRRHSLILIRTRGRIQNLR